MQRIGAQQFPQGARVPKIAAEIAPLKGLGLPLRFADDCSLPALVQTYDIDLMDETTILAIRALAISPYFVYSCAILIH